MNYKIDLEENITCCLSQASGAKMSPDSSGVSYGGRQAEEYVT